jgi:hypothetical protein
MSDEVIELRTELRILDGRIQAERNDEVRHGLQRGRLEAERAQLLVKLMDAQLAQLVAPACDEPHAAPDGIKTVTIPAEREVPVASSPQKHKPDGLPTYQQMVQTVLNNAAPKWLAPRQITAVIRQTWWSDIPRHKAASTAWGMAQAGRLDSRRGRYRAKPNGHAREATANLGNGAAGSIG